MQTNKIPIVLQMIQSAVKNNLISLEMSEDFKNTFEKEDTEVPLFIVLNGYFKGWDFNRISKNAPDILLKLKENVPAVFNLLKSNHVAELKAKNSNGNDNIKGFDKDETQSLIDRAKYDKLITAKEALTYSKVAEQDNGLIVKHILNLVLNWDFVKLSENAPCVLWWIQTYHNDNYQSMLSSYIQQIKQNLNN